MGLLVMAAGTGESDGLFGEIREDACAYLLRGKSNPSRFSGLPRPTSAFLLDE